ncbi:hypothetical protein D3C85_1534700 [compost metagenome]
MVPESVKALASVAFSLSSFAAVFSFKALAIITAACSLVRGWSGPKNPSLSPVTIPALAAVSRCSKSHVGALTVGLISKNVC